MKKSTNNLHESRKIIRIVNNLFGLRFLEFPPGHLRICWSLFYLFLLWSAWAFFIYNENIKYLFLRPVNIYFILKDASVKGLITFFGCYYSELYWIFNEKLKNADEIVRKLGVPETSREIYSTYLFFVGWVLPSFLKCGYDFALFLLQNGSFFNAVYFICFNTYDLLVVTLVFLDFAVCVRNIKNGLEKVNYLLEGLIAEYGLEIGDEEQLNRPDVVFFRKKKRSNLEFSQSNSPIFESSWKVSKKDEKMRNLLQLSRLIHLELSTASKMLYMMFHVQLMILLLLGFMYIANEIIDIYSIIKMNRWTIWNLALRIIYLIYYCSKIFCISYFCEKATREGQKTLELVYTCSSADGINPETMDEIHQFSLQITQMNYGALKVNNYFKMDYNFVRKFTIRVTTYVLIMIEIFEWNFANENWINMYRK